MRSLRWLIVTGAVILGILIVAAAITSIWLNSYIHSSAFKADIESRAAQSLGGPVTIESIDFDILHGVKLQGLNTQLDPSHSGGEGAIKMQVARVNCTYSLIDLLAFKLRLTGITLDQPQIVLTKQAGEATSQSAPRKGAESPTGSTASSTTATSSSDGKSLPFQFVLDQAKISDGTLALVDANGATTVDVKGLNVDADTSGYSEGKDVTGKVKIGTVTASGMVVRNFSSPVTYHTNFVSAKPFDATAFDGNISGGYLLDGSTPSTLDLNGKGLSVQQILAQASPNSSAKLSGSLDLQSKWRSIESGDLQGEGDAQMTSGKLQGVKLLENVGSILRINELSDPTITKAQTHFVVQNRVAKFIGLQVDSPAFKLTGDGTVVFSGALDANLVLVLNRETLGKMPKEIRGSFVQQQDGTGSIAFHVSGTTSDPKTDLPQKLLFQNTEIKNVINKTFNRLFK